MKTLLNVVVVRVMSGVALLVMAASARAESGVWTNSSGTEYWTNGANWSGASYPGSGAAESAYLTNDSVSGYTVVHDTTLANPLTNLNMGNTSGETWLLVSSSLLRVTNVDLAARATIQVDNGGVVSNASSLYMGTVVGTAGNRLIVTNGGSYVVSNCYVGALTNAGGNSVVVNGGSMRVGTTLNVGALVNTGPFNTVLVTNASLSSVNVFVGGADGNSGSVSNRVEVQANSIWTISASLGVSTFNQSGKDANVFVINGGIVTNAGNTTVGSGNQTSCRDNMLIVTNGGRLIKTGGTVTIGGGAGAVGTRLVVDGNGSFMNAAGMALTIGNSRFFTTGLSNRVEVVNSGVLTNVGALTLSWPEGTPSVGGYHHVSVASGGRLYSRGSVMLGYQKNTNNFVTVTGSSSLWDVGKQTLTIGGSTGNWVKVDGGVITNVGTVYVGQGTNGCMNALWVTNGGMLSVTGSVTVGYQGGTSNSAVICSNATCAVGGDVTLTGTVSRVLLKGGVMFVTNGALTIHSSCTADFEAESGSTVYLKKGVDGGAIDTMNDVASAISSGLITKSGIAATPSDFSIQEVVVGSVTCVKTAIKPAIRGTVICIR